MKNVFFSFVFVMACALSARDVLMTGFDTTKDLRKWTVRAGTFEHVPWPDATPGNCGKLTFFKYQGKGERWPALMWDYNPPASWLAYETVHFSFQAETPVEFNISFVSGKTHTSVKVKLKTGMNKFSVPLANLAAKGIDLNQVRNITIFVYEPTGDVVFYVGPVTFTQKNPELLCSELLGFQDELKQYEKEKVPAAVEAVLRKHRNVLLAEIVALQKAGENADAVRVGKLRKDMADFRQFRRESILTAAPGETLAYWTNSLEKIHPVKPVFLEAPKSVGYLEAARGEGESLQLAVYSRKNIQNAKVEITRLPAAANGTVLPASAVSIDPVGLIYCDVPKYDVPRSGLWPDPILNYAKAISLNAGNWQSWWLDVNVPENQLPGVYSGEVTLSGDGIAPVKMPFRVKVRNFTLPPELPPYPMMFGVSQESPLSFFTPMQWEQFRLKIYDELRKNRIQGDIIYSRADRIVPIEDIQYRVKHGAAFFNVINYGFFPENRLQYLDRWMPEYRKLGIADKAVMYGLDERFESEMDKMVNTLSKLKAKYPEIPLLTTAYTYVSAETNPMNQYIDAWMPTTEKFEEYLPLVRRLQKSGKKVWWYIAFAPFQPYANFLIETPAPAHRMLMGLQFWKFQSDGFLYYAAVGWRHRDLKTGKTTSETRYLSGAPIVNYKGAKYYTGVVNGDGALIYPAESGMVSSIRVKAIRDGLDDYLYLKLLSQALDNSAAMPETWRQQAAKELTIEPELVKTLYSYTQDPTLINAKRARLADLLEAYCGTPANPPLHFQPFKFKTPLWK